MADEHHGGEAVGVALLGSTGSIGRQAVDVLGGLGEHLRVVALSAGTDHAGLSEQLARFRPAAAAMTDEAAAAQLELPQGTQFVRGPDAQEQLAIRDDVGMVIVATGGVVSLRPVLAALRAGKIVATANKETLVCGGHLVMPLARKQAATVAAARPADPYASPLAWLRPIDSEHSAIWQCLTGEDLTEVARLVLTGSGGPFREWPQSRLATATPEQALAHPTWSMGAKITVDSATLMNKGLEVIEAHWLYDVAYSSIDVVIHPQSIVHSLVEFVDGSLKAQLGLPDMRIPIQYALTAPRRRPGPAPRLDLVAHPELTFERPDEARFRAVAVAREAGKLGPWATAALTFADEVAVRRFLAGSLSFTGIAEVARAAVERFGGAPGEPSLEDLEALDREVTDWAQSAGPVRA